MGAMQHQTALPILDSYRPDFPGQVRDTETLNDFFNARYFTAPLMRFLSPDPGNAGADPTDPQTWNAYAYVRNNPLAFVDPSGMGSAVPCQSQNSPAGCIPPTTDVSAYTSYINQQMWSSSNDLAYGSDVFQLIVNQAENPVGYALSASENGTLIPVYGDTIFMSPSGSNTTSAQQQPSNTPAKSGNPQQQSSTDWPKIGKAALSCAADHYGLTALAGGAGVLGIPVPKSWLGLAPGFAGASENTSVAGAIGFKLFGAAEPRIGVRLLGTTRLFGVIGRAAPIVSAALFTYDAASIGYCTYEAVK